MKITAYVPCHNHEATLPEVLAALRRQTRPADQYLFRNDRCTDRSAAIAREHGFEVIAETGAPGLAAGRNLALKHAMGDILVGIDADVVAAPNYLEELEKQFLANPHAAAIGGRLLERHTQSPADLWRAVHMRQEFGDHSIVNPPFLFGATTSVRVADIKKVGGWTERYLTSFEDVDLSLRLRKAGLNLLYAPTVRAEHIRRDTLQSVLGSFWSWHYHGSENMFSSIPVWLFERMPMIWKRYRVCRLEDLRHPVLPPITLLLPWAWAIRDLHALSATVGDIGRLSDIGGAAVILLTRFGCGEAQAAVLKRHLDELMCKLQPRTNSGTPLRQDILNTLMLTAAESIPDGNYWGICNAALAKTP